LLITGLSVNHDKIKAALSPEIFATHLALQLVKDGVPFRAAYQQAAQTYHSISVPQDSVNQSLHIGGLGNLGLAELYAQHTTETKIFHTTYTHHHTSINSLLTRKGTDEK